MGTISTGTNCPHDPVLIVPMTVALYIHCTCSCTVNSNHICTYSALAVPFSLILNFKPETVRVMCSKFTGTTRNTNFGGVNHHSSFSKKNPTNPFSNPVHSYGWWIHGYVIYKSYFIGWRDVETCIFIMGLVL